MGIVTERKPPGVTFETWIDRQIREAQERGDFENLPGRGAPIADLGEHHDELWWIRRLVQREKIETLPPTLRLRKERDAAFDAIAASDSEVEVREIVADLNGRIREVNRKATEGPPSDIMTLDVERVVDSWRARRALT
jgi:hypothetical protein